MSSHKNYYKKYLKYKSLYLSILDQMIGGKEKVKCETCGAKFDPEESGACRCCPTCDSYPCECDEIEYGQDDDSVMVRCEVCGVKYPEDESGACNCGQSGGEKIRCETCGSKYDPDESGACRCCDICGGYPCECDNDDDDDDEDDSVMVRCETCGVKYPEGESGACKCSDDF